MPALLLVCGGLVGHGVAATMQIPFAGFVGGFLLVLGLVNAKWEWNRIPQNVLVKIGDASYSLYLIHFILVALCLSRILCVGILANVDAY